MADHTEHQPHMTRAQATERELEELHELLEEVLVYLDTVVSLLEDLVASQT